MRQTYDKAFKLKVAKDIIHERPEPVKAFITSIEQHVQAKLQTISLIYNEPSRKNA
jgi:hypothetical protein